MDKYTKAFAVFDLTPDADEATTAKAYKKFALKHHPDRNFGNKEESTRKFQEIGAAWETCQSYFAMRNAPPDQGFGGFSRDDEVPLDRAEAEAFFQWLFEEVFAGRYTRAKTRRYRNARSGAAGGGVYMFTESYASSQQRQEEHRKKQRREHEEYLERVREFERECEAEEREERRKAKEALAQANRLASAQAAAFQAARTGDIASIRKAFSKFDIQVNSPERSGKNRAPEGNFDTMLHAAARSSQSNADMIEFLLDKGADVSAISREQLTAFHLAARSGNVGVAKVLLARKDVHPSRAAPNGQTPLQLAIKSENLDMLRLVVKDATVHDVRRCWDLDDVSNEMKDVLKTKKGFIDPNAVVESVSTKQTKADQRKAANARAREEKAARIAEEERRAEANRQKREAKEEQARIREAEEVDRRRKAQETELARVRREQDEARRRAEQEQARLVEERRKREMEERRLAEQAALAQQRREAQRIQAEERRQSLRKTAERRRKEEEERELVKERQREEAEGRRLEDEYVRAQRQAEIQRERVEQQKRSRKDASEKRLAMEATRVQRPQRATKQGMQDITLTDMQAQIHPSERISETPQKKSRYQNQREKREVRANVAEMTDVERRKWEKREARREEQSIRDKARAAQAKEERLRKRDAVPSQATHRLDQEHANSAISWTEQPEDVQTGPTIDDLFAPEPRKPRQSSTDDSGIVMPDEVRPSSQPDATSTFRGYRGRGRGRGRGSRGRGRGRGRGFIRGAE